MEQEIKGNVIMTPDFEKIGTNIEPNMQIDTNLIQSNSVLNRSSMITYSKIVCCICSASINANAKGMCDACEKAGIDITDGITKQGLMHYCKLCDRYLSTHWIKCPPESQEMMSLCLSKIRGLNKVKLVDSSFVWTEPHSKIIKLKLTVHKEMNKSVIETNFLVEFKVEWTQCEDCKKTFTPHIWNAACQIRQKVDHKRTFMYLEQMILKHKAHAKALNVKELPEGVDFYFLSKSQAGALTDFVSSVLPVKTKQSRQLISHDQHSNLYTYKYTFMLEIAPVCKEDLIVLDKEMSKELGGIGPVLLCYKVASKIHLLNPLTFDTYDFDGNSYWKYEFKSYIDRSCLSEFLIINVEEEIDYKKKYLKSSKASEDVHMDTEELSASNSKLNQSKSTQYRKNASLSSLDQAKETKSEFKIVTVQCIRNKTITDGNIQLITTRSHLGKKIKPGDLFLGYDLTEINVADQIGDTLSIANGSFPDVILVRKKYQNTKRLFKLKHIDKEMDVEMVKNKKKMNEYEQQYEEFLKDIGENKDMRKNINLYKDDAAIKDLEMKFTGLKVKDKQEEGNDSDVDIKVEELLDELTIEDKEKKDSIDNNDPQEKNIDEEIFAKPVDKKIRTGKKIIGKRERSGKKIDEK